MFLSLTIEIFSQDIHFSQFWEPSAFVNPTQIGNFDGDLKITAHYRNQWSQFNTPITSMFGDVTYKLNKENQYWAFSLSMLRDQQSNLSYHQLRMAGSVSYQKRFSKVVLGGLGFQVGTRLTSIDYNKLTYNAQWDPISGQFLQSNPSYENFSAKDVYTPYLAMGTSVNIQKKKVLHTIDFAAMYVSENKRTDFVFYQPFKLTFNYHNYYTITNKVTLMPKLGFITTASANSVNSGLLVKVNLSEYNDLYAGMLYRWGIDRNGDALIPVVGCKLKKLRVGFSYDYVTSGLNQEGHKSAYEVSASYIFKSAKHKYFSIDCLRL